MVVVSDFGKDIVLTDEEKKIGNELIEKMIEPSDAYEYLISYKNKISKEAYGVLARNIYKMNTRGVDRDLMVELFEYIDQKYLMTAEEFESYNKLPDRVFLFRGTDKSEDKPRLSWSLDPYVVYDTYIKGMHPVGGALFTAIVNKWAEIYFIANDNEKEVVANASYYWKKNI